MKLMGKIWSVCALTLAVVMCHGSSDVIEQKISIKNESGEPIYGGVYLTNAAGKIYNKQAGTKTLVNGGCMSTMIEKSQKTQDRLFKYYRIIFSNDEANMLAKIRSNASSNITSLSIKQLSGAKPLYYAIKPSEALFTGKKTLKIEKTGAFECTLVDDIANRTTAGLTAVGALLSQGVQKARRAINNSFSSSDSQTEAAQARRTGNRIQSPEEQAIRARHAARNSGVQL